MHPEDTTWATMHLIHQRQIDQTVLKKGVETDYVCKALYALWTMM